MHVKHSGAGGIPEARLAHRLLAMQISRAAWGESAAPVATDARVGHVPEKPVDVTIRFAARPKSRPSRLQSLSFARPCLLLGPDALFSFLPPASPPCLIGHQGRGPEEREACAEAVRICDMWCFNSVWTCVRVGMYYADNCRLSCNTYMHNSTLYET